ncbi:MAG: endonuclease/exonuclease/phosphatase family protein [Armatimonadetes bacterium]|nr:endonuclease/exonuclease/phosphatase family protein [Armatimonadota bacterium]
MWLRTKREDKGQKLDWVVVWPLISFLVALIAIAVYGFQPDALAAWTVWPPGVTAVIWLIVPLLRRPSTWRKIALIPVVPWVAFLLAYGDEWRAIVPHSVPSTELHVVTLNCAGGMLEAVREAVDTGADIVLLQESPGPDELQDLVADLPDGYSVVSGIDASVIARGDLTVVLQEQNFTMVRFSRGDDLQLDIVSLRMVPPVLRMDYWNPNCWRAYAEDRRRHRAELAEIWTAVDKVRSERPLILGGDFNVVPVRNVTALLEHAGLQDAWSAAGRGWYATMLNSAPVVRIDRIWASGELRPKLAKVKKTKYSDHRMVEAWFDVQR